MTHPMDDAVWALLQASEMIGFLALAGFGLALHRMRTTPNRQIMMGFALIMLGCALREAVVYLNGAVTWGTDAIVWSALARYVWIAGAVLFVRAITFAKCGEWAWIGILLAATSFAAVI